MIFKILDIIAPALLGFLCLLWNEDKKRLLYFLSVYFFYTSFGELVGLLLSIYFPDEANFPFYDKFIIPTSYLAEYFLFWWVMKQREHRLIIISLTAIYIISFLIEKFAIQYTHSEFSYFSYCLGAIISMLICLMYLFTLVQSSAILYFKKDIMFWFSIGSLFFQLFTFPFYALMDLWFKYPKIGTTYYYVTFFCIYISYTFYLTGLLCLKRK